MGKVFRSGRYANVTATMALIVALGGTSYAAITLPKNSVGSKQIRKNAVTNSKIRGSAVTSSKVKNGSLLSADFKSGQLPAGPAGPAGAAGAKGDTGAKGATGDTGPAGSALAYANLAADGTVNVANSKNVTQANINHVATGVYCIFGLSFTPHSVVGNIDISGGGATPGPYVHVDIGPNSGCPAETQVTVDTLNNNTFTDRPLFFVLN